jgi:hypothetical protein
MLQQHLLLTKWFVPTTPSNCLSKNLIKRKRRQRSCNKEKVVEYRREANMNKKMEKGMNRNMKRGR